MQYKYIYPKQLMLYRIRVYLKCMFNFILSMYSYMAKIYILNFIKHNIFTCDLFQLKFPVVIMAAPPAHSIYKSLKLRNNVCRRFVSNRTERAKLTIRRLNDKCFCDHICQCLPKSLANVGKNYIVF